jgi:NADH dehydrogenase
MTPTHVVTGASGYTGRYITRRLLDGGAEVRSLTGHPDRPSPFERRVETYPYRFDDPDKLASSLEGADTLFNTYWIRFARGGLTHDRAVENLRTLFDAAKVAGVRRVVHISITNATEDSPSPYFRGKALAERALRESALSYAILRPTLIFGREDILLNNIAWMLRRFPVHPIAGSGEYRVQPISVDDLADIAIRLARESENVEIDAVGPEVFTYEDMVRLVRDKIGASAWLVHVSNSAAMLAARLMGLLVRDVVLTRDEIDGLTADLLVSKTGEPPPGTTRLSEWLDDNARLLGSKYASELMRHYK